jgi:hypothetical protein
MKNIHLIPTDKPSRLVKFFTNKFHLCKEILPIQDEEQYQNIYITSDEEIKKGQNYIGDGFSGKNKFKWHKSQIETYPNIKKDVIVLTTDQDLIEDGVQAIDDTFLEWFVKNPSCESVEVKQVKTFNGFLDPEYGSPKYKFNYHIIIPKEEPKQETLEEVAQWVIDNRYAKSELEKVSDSEMYNTIIDKCAKWQQERMYSEEEVRIAIFTSFLSGVDRGFYSKEIEDKIIQKFKKK